MSYDVATVLKALPLLETLCTATAQTLEPTPLAADEYLFVRMDNDNRRFEVQARRMRVERIPVKYIPFGSLSKNDYDTEHDYYSGPENEYLEAGDTGLKIFCYGPCQFDGHVSTNASSRWIQRVPEKYQNLTADGYYSLAATDFTALVIAHQWPETQLRFETPIVETMYRFLIARFMVQTKNSLIGANYKINGVAPTMPVDFFDHPENPLSVYQKCALLMQLGTEAFFLDMEQGTGKTPIAIARIMLEARRHYAKTGKQLRVMIICPRQCRGNWANEINRFATAPGKIVVLRGGKIRRFNGIADAMRQEPGDMYSIVIASYQSISRTWEAIGHEKMEWDLVIADEAHYMRNHRADQSMSPRQLREKSRMRVILTGTPIVNKVMDVWAQWEFLGDGLSGFMQYENFKSFYGKFEKDKGSRFQKMVSHKNLPLIKERLARMSFSITKKEANLQLPEKVYDIWEVGLTGKQREYYVKLAKELALEIKAELKDKTKSKTLTANHILTRMLRLAQITSGHVRWDAQYDDEGNIVGEGRVEQIDKANGKVEAILEMLEEDRVADPNCKMIVWACFREDIRILSEALREKGIKFVQYFGGVKDADREQNIKTFNTDPECRVFIGNPQSAAEGLNLLGYDWWNGADYKLQTYAGHEVFFSQNWSPVLRAQAEDRAHRRGTRQIVRITDLTILGTIDEEIRAVVHGKRKMALEVKDVTEILQRIADADIDAEDGDNNANS